MELSDRYPVSALCRIMLINRSGFYKWLSRRTKPSNREVIRTNACSLFELYHNRFPSHGYRWLNAKIKLDLGIIYSDNFAHKICKFKNIKSLSKHVKRYGKVANKEIKTFPNFILASLNPSAPFQIIVTDMTAFWANSHYYELTLFMDLFNNEIIAYSLSNKKGDPNSYHLALQDVLKKKEQFKDFITILHSDQGSVYSSKKFNDSLPINHILHSMSKPGTPTENGAMEAINGWMKEELFIDFHINSSLDIFSEIDRYIHFFNFERPQSSLHYLTPIQFKSTYFHS